MRTATRRTRRALVAAAAVVVVATELPRAEGTVRTWVGADGLFWNNSAAWNPAAVPVNGDDVILGTAGAATSSVQANFTSAMSGAGLNSLKINSTGIGGTFTVSQFLTTSVMLANSEIIGDTIGANVYTQSAGSNSSLAITLGNQSAGFGTYSLSGTGTVTTMNLLVGNNGAGAFNQSGGTVTINSYLGVSQTNNTTGSVYNLSGGTLAISSGAYVGVGSARGSFVHTGGTLLYYGANNLFVSNASSAAVTNSYSLSGTGLISNVGYASIGTSGAGGGAAFVQSGGTNSFAPGGQMNVGDLGPGSYSLSAGSLSVTTVAVGNHANGSFTQSGGAHTISGANAALKLGQDTGTTGAYTLSGTGVLSAPTVSVGVNGTGSFTQNGGTHNVGSSLVVGAGVSSAGSYTLGGGMLAIGTAPSPGNLIVGNGGSNATFTQTGGTLTAPGGAIVVGQTAGRYNLKGGSVTTDTLSVGPSGNGTFVQSGGTMSVTGNGFGGLFMADWGGSKATYSLSTTDGPAVLNTTSVYVGYGGNAEFDQNGTSTHTVSSLLAISPGVGGTGLYYVLNGTLNANAIQVGGNWGDATFRQDGGTVTVGAGGLIVNPGSDTAHGPSVYRLLSGTLNVPAGVTAYTQPGGTFSQTGGTYSGDMSNAGSYYYTYGAFNGFFDNAVTGTLTFGTQAGFLAGKGFLNRGTLTITPGNGVGVSGAGYQFDNQGIVELAGGGFLGAGNIVNNATMTGWGSINGSGGFVNNGVFNQGAGTLVISNSGVNTNNAAMTLAAGRQVQVLSNLTNAGSLELNSTVVTGVGTLTNSAAGVLRGPGTVSANFVNAGTLLTPAGTTRVTANFTNAGLIQLDDVAANLNGGTVNNTGTIQGIGKVANAVTNAGTITPAAGTLTLSGPLTNNGLLLVPPSAKLLVTGAFASNGGTITLQGGTFDTNNQALSNASVIAGYGTLSTGGAGLTNNGSITFTGGNTTVTGPVTNAAGKTLEVRFNPALFTGAVVNNGTIKVTGTTATFAGSYAGIAPSAPEGLATDFSFQTFSLGAANDGGLTGPGALVVDPAGTVVTSYVRQNSLVAMSGTILTRPSAAGGQTSVLSSLTLTGTASFDLADNKMVLDGADAAAVTAATAALRGYLFNNNVTSSIAAADPQQRLGIGYASSAELGVATWGGQAVDATAVLTKMTYRGDANLDGKIDADDFALIDRGFAKHLSTWVFGDFNYDGQVTSADYLLIDRVFMQQTGVLSPSLLAQREAQFGEGYVAELLTSVPEPSLAGGGLIAAAAMFARRRRA